MKSRTSNAKRTVGCNMPSKKNCDEKLKLLSSIRRFCHASIFYKNAQLFPIVILSRFRHRSTTSRLQMQSPQFKQIR